MLLVDDRIVVPLWQAGSPCRGLGGKWRRWRREQVREDGTGTGRNVDDGLLQKGNCEGSGCGDRGSGAGLGLVSKQVHFYFPFHQWIGIFGLQSARAGSSAPLGMWGSGVYSVLFPWANDLYRNQRLLFSELSVSLVIETATSNTALLQMNPSTLSSFASSPSAGGKVGSPVSSFKMRLVPPHSRPWPRQWKAPSCRLMRRIEGKSPSIN